MLLRAHHAAAGRVRGARLPLGIGLEGLPGDRRGVRHSAAEGPARVRSPARADLHAGHQGRIRPRREHQRSRGGAAWSAPICSRASRRLTLALYAHGVAHAESQGHHPRRHEVRVRAHRRRRAAADRRSDDAGFVALLAEGHVMRPAVRNRASTSSTCATISSRSSGTSSRRCRRCRTTSSATRARSTSTRIAASRDGNWTRATSAEATRGHAVA